MIKIKFIPSKGNSPTQVYNTHDSHRFRLTNKYGNTKSNIYYDGFLANSNEPIISGDWSIITNPYDGEEYTVQCKKVDVENNREIYYGMEGTRCLLSDVTKIIGTTDNSLKEVNQIIVTEEMLKEYESEPLSFMEEDLLE